jgi:hypothetical protein
MSAFRASFGSLSLASIACLTAVLMLGGCAKQPAEPEIAGVSPELRRITLEQYGTTINYLFGAAVELTGARVDPLVRTQGLLRLGAGNARITPRGFEEFYALGRSIAEQVVSQQNRGFLIPCVPADPGAADAQCAANFLAEVGSVLYRRPLAPEELDLAVAVAADAADELQDFYEGLALALTSMLVAPQFLFVADQVIQDASAPGSAVSLSPYSKAARLSFFLWNAPPDQLLLTAARDGDLDTRAGLEAQVDRMLASPRLDDGVRAFFSDLLHFDDFETLEKDARIYPAFTPAVAVDAREHVLLDITHHLLVERRDYRALFTSRQTHVSPSLARIYGIPFVADHIDGWKLYEFPEGSPRVGLTSMVGYSALHAHPGRSSPTLRGMALREMLLCQNVPPPPSDVDFTLFLDPDAPQQTARQRLDAHNTLPACTGCHLITDPIGLGLENFDGIGAFRVTENDAPLDVAGDLDGIEFDNPQGLGLAIYQNPALVPCLVNRLVSYGTGRAMDLDDEEYVDYLAEKFASAGHDFVHLMRSVALSNAFFKVALPPDWDASVVASAD